jgi:magnesium-transporting ATPase (P-type)
MGVAMGQEGTDVARESAEMILADDNFATIVVAVQEGRVVWDNLRKVLLFNTPVNNAQGLTVLFGMIARLPYSPLTPIQVLYCNLICAVTLGFVLAVEPAEKGIMDRPPRKVGKRLIGRYLLFRIAFASVVLVAFTVGAVMWVHGWNVDQDIDSFGPSDVKPGTTTTWCEASGATTTKNAMFGENNDQCCLYNHDCNPWVEAGESGNDGCNNKDFIVMNPSVVIPEGSPSGLVCPNVKGRALVRAQASNTLTLSAISIMLSARFAYNSALHPRIFRGNKYAWLSAFITATLQVLITYIPGLNMIVFQMGPMNGPQWGICFLFVLCTFLCMEFEKAIMRFLKMRKFDTDDENDQYGFEQTPPHNLDATEDFVTTMSQRSAAMRETLLHK